MSSPVNQGTISCTVKFENINGSSIYKAVSNQTESVSIGGLNWKFVIPTAESDRLKLELECSHEYEASNLWWCKTEVNLEITKENEEKINKTFQFRGTRNYMKFWFRDEYMIGDLVKVLGYEPNVRRIHEVKFKADVNITSVSGVRKVVEIPTSPDVGTEVCLQVGDQKLSVNSNNLLTSSFFSPLLDTEYKENSKIEIKDIDEFEAFAEFINFVNHQQKVITDKNVESLGLKAEKYDIPFLKIQCEDFLISTTSISLFDKLRISESCRYSKLQLNLLDNITKREIKELVKDVESLGRDTSQALLEKVCIIVKRKQEAEKAALDAKKTPKDQKAPEAQAQGAVAMEQ